MRDEYDMNIHIMMLIMTGPAKMNDIVANGVLFQNVFLHRNEEFSKKLKRTPAKTQRHQNKTQSYKYKTKQIIKYTEDNEKTNKTKQNIKQNRNKVSKR